ncbi:MAG: ABC transporter permease subunit, partial [Halodesulfovibrio sp.]
FARAKGLSNTRIIGLHVMKNIMIPVVTVLGMELGNLIAFAVVTETIFAWPGMGKLVRDSLGVRDRPSIEAYLLITVTMFIILNLGVDIRDSILDPRGRLVPVR